MSKWFECQYSLRRLAIATVFLGVILGLNLRRVGPMRPPCITYSYVCYWGWPLPFIVEEREKNLWADPNRLTAPYVPDKCQTAEDFLITVEMKNANPSAWTNKFPFTHLTYYMVDCDLMRWLSSVDNRLTVCRVIDVVMVLLVTLLILFLRWPRRQTDTHATETLAEAERTQ